MVNSGCWVIKHAPRALCHMCCWSECVLLRCLCYLAGVNVRCPRYLPPQILILFHPPSFSFWITATTQIKLGNLTKNWVQDDVLALHTVQGAVVSRSTSSSCCSSSSSRRSSRSSRSSSSSSASSVGYGIQRAQSGFENYPVTTFHAKCHMHR